MADPFRTFLPMSTFALVVTCFAGLFAFGFLFAGCLTLCALDQTEREELQHKMRKLPPPGILEAFFFPFSRHPEVAEMLLANLPTHWRTRPDARRAIWLGLAFLAIALIAGQFASMPR